MGKAAEKSCRKCGCTEDNACILVHRQTDEEIPCWWEPTKKGFLCHGCYPRDRRIADRVVGRRLSERACGNPACKKTFAPCCARGRRPMGCSPECQRLALNARRRDRQRTARRSRGEGIVVNATCPCGLFLRHRKRWESHRAKCRFVVDQVELPLPPPVRVRRRKIA